MKKRLRDILIVIFCVLTLLYGIQAQQTDTLIKVEPKPCEFNNLMLEQANREAGKDSLIVLIARSGIKDTKKDISRKRLYTAKAYLVDYSKLRNSETVIVAEGLQERNLYYGGVEIYVNGKLLDILTSSHNGLLTVGGCDYSDAEDEESRTRDSLLYPWLYKNKKKTN